MDARFRSLRRIVNTQPESSEADAQRGPDLVTKALIPIEKYSRRLLLATVALILVALWSLGRGVQDEITDPGYSHPDWGRKYDERFQQLKKSLPALSTVGYISDWGLLGDPAPRMDDPAAKQDLQFYFLTRYALAPLRVVHNINQEYVVGNLKDPRSLDDIAKRTNLDVVHDFGDGVVLFRGHSK